MTNAIMVIHPYKHEGVWVFDDPAAELVKEPFVSGADEIIDKMVVRLDNPEPGFNLIFSGNPFPGYHYSFFRQREEFDGWWYSSDDFDMSGWLCPALFKYFDEAPETLYVQVVNFEQNRTNK